MAAEEIMCVRRGLFTGCISNVNSESFSDSKAELLECKDGQCGRSVGVSVELALFCGFPY
jgi:hypothetical protein